MLQGVADNLGNTFAVSKLMTSKFPLVVILAELAALLRGRSMALSLGWVPRDQNEEADALTNGDFASFQKQLRVDVDVAQIPWLILPRMLEVAGEIYERVRKSKEEGGPPKAVARRKAGTFRQRNPW